MTTTMLALLFGLLPFQKDAAAAGRRAHEMR